MPAQVIRYLIVGVTSVAVYFAVLSFLTSHEGAPRIGSIFVAYALATVVNYLANYYWAFAAEASHHQAMGRYALIVVAGLLWNELGVASLAVMQTPLMLAAFICAATWPLISFFALRLWAFRDTQRMHYRSRG